MNFHDVTSDKVFLMRLVAFKKKHCYPTEAAMLEAMIRLGMFFKSAPPGSVITRSATGVTGYEPEKTLISNEGRTDEIVF